MTTTAAQTSRSILAKQERVAHANALIRAIGSHGRRFFYNREADRYASLELDARGRVWWIDDYRGARVYTHDVMGHSTRWRGFSHGGTLRSLAEDMRDYVLTGQPIHHGRIAQRSLASDQNIWGYGEDAAQALRAETEAMPIFAKATGAMS